MGLLWESADYKLDKPLFDHRSMWRDFNYKCIALCCSIVIFTLSREQMFAVELDWLKQTSFHIVACRLLLAKAKPIFSEFAETR